jgi:HEAT repeat protein
MVNHQKSNREALIAASRRAAEPIVAELAQLGFQLEGVSDLYKRLRPAEYEADGKTLKIERMSDLYREPIDYRVAIPVLIKWLPLVNDIAVKTELVRALSTKWAKPEAAQPLIEEFRKAPMEKVSFKWAIGNALSEVADATVFDEVAELVRDKQHGRAREMLAVALANTKAPQAVDILVELLDDEQIAGHALMGLRKLAPPEARGAIERFVDHPKAWVRKEARRALAKIDKKLVKSGQ